MRAPNRSDAPPVGVLAVQGAVAEHRAALESVGARSMAVRTGADLERVEGLVIPGGESTTVSLVAGEAGLLQEIRQRTAAGMPVFGTCAGMIMLADAVVDGSPVIGGIDIRVRRNAYGRQAASFEAQIDAPTLGDSPLPGVFIRAPWVEHHGPGVEVLARHGGRPVIVRQGRLLASAFHPELTADTRLHAAFIATLPGNPSSHARAQGDARVRTQ